jgi:hypothetical protein
MHCASFLHCSPCAPPTGPSVTLSTAFPCSEFMLHPNSRIRSLRTMNNEQHNCFMCILNHPFGYNKHDYTSLAWVSKWINSSRELRRFFFVGNKWVLTYKVSGFIPTTNTSWWQTRKQSVQNNLHFLFDKEYVLVQSRLITNLHKNGL